MKKLTLTLVVLLISALAVTLTAQTRKKSRRTTKTTKTVQSAPKGVKTTIGDWTLISPYEVLEDVNEVRNGVPTIQMIDMDGKIVISCGDLSSAMPAEIGSTLSTLFEQGKDPVKFKQMKNNMQQMMGVSTANVKTPKDLVDLMLSQMFLDKYMGQLSKIMLGNASNYRITDVKTHTVNDYTTMFYTKTVPDYACIGFIFEYKGDCSVTGLMIAEDGVDNTKYLKTVKPVEE